MREITLGESTLSVKATPLAMLFYRQEFGSDMTRDFLAVVGGFASVIPGMNEADVSTLGEMETGAASVTLGSLSQSGIDGLGVLKLVWAMGKAGALPERWPGFETWLATLDDVNVFDQEFIAAALEVAADGLFRSTGKPAPPVKQRKRAS